MLFPRLKLFSFVISSVLLASTASRLSAQAAIAGRITGTVTDSSGASIVGAKITVESPALMVPSTTQSKQDGTYVLDLLPLGSYQVTIESSGFKRFVQTGVVLQAGFTATVNATLEPGTLQQAVTVESTPAVDVQTVTTATTFNEALLQNIPSGRDPWSTVEQAPGVTSSTVDVAGSQSYQQSYMQVHGSMPGEQAYSWNGLTLNWPGSSGGYTAFYINHDALGEFQVVTDNASAEVGVGGMYMNMITKSGSNQIHGLLAAYYLTSALEANQSLPMYNGQAVQAGTPFVMSLDTTSSLGLPIIKDKLWLFGSWRRYDIREDVLAVRRTDGQPINDINHQSNTDSRLDWQVNSKNRASFIWLYNEENRFFRRDTSYSFVSDQASWRQIEPAYILEGLWTMQVTNSLVLDFRIGYQHLIFPLSYQATVGANSVNTVDYTLSTETGAAPYNYVNPAENTRGSVTASYYKSGFVGSHDVKFGFEAGRQKNGNYYSMNVPLTAIYNNGAPLEVTVYNTPVQAVSAIHDWAAYLQDTWHAGRRLTLDLGVRFEHFRNFNPAQSSTGTSPYLSLFDTPRSFAQSPNIVNWNDAGPRLGLAYDVTGKGKSVVRLAYSRFYRIEGTELADAVNPNTLSTLTYLWNGATSNGIPVDFATPANLVGSSGGVYTTVSKNLKHPYSDEFTAGFEQQVAADLALAAHFYYRTNENQIGTESTVRLPSDYAPISNLNGTFLTNPLTGNPLTLYNLAPSVASLTNQTIVTNIPALDNYRYRGVELTATKRLSHRWQVLAGLTIQRTTGDYGNGTPNAIYDDFNDPNQNINRGGNYLFLDSTYVWKVNGTYNFPLGISASMSFQHYTGYPIRPTDVFTGLNQGEENVALEVAGPIRLPAINLLDLRIARPIDFKEGKLHLEPICDLFNLTNANTVTSEVSSYGPAYLEPTNVLNPFVARFGLRLSF